MSASISIDRTTMRELFALGYGVEDVQVVALRKADKADKRMIRDFVTAVWRQYHGIPRRKQAA